MKRGAAPDEGTAQDEESAGRSDGKDAEQATTGAPSGQPASKDRSDAAPGSEAGGPPTEGSAAGDSDEVAKPKRRRRRRRRSASRATPAEDQGTQVTETSEDGASAGAAPEAAKPDAAPKGDAEADTPRPVTKKRGGRRRRRSVGKTKSTDEAGDPAQAAADVEQDAAAKDGVTAEPPPADTKSPQRRRRRRTGRKTRPAEAETPDEPTSATGEPEPQAEAEEQAPPEEPATRTQGRRSRARGKTDLPEAPLSKLRQGREMLISVSPGEECRVALTLDGKLEELFIERASAESHVGNIYKGRVTNVEPSIQAAFVDFGLHQNGFLHISDLVPQYFPGYDGEPEDIGRKTPHRHRPPIQRCLRRGQEVIVQITKEGIGTKGPTLNTYISLPGRFLVMMPGMSRLGVSRKIEDEEDRHKMRQALNQLTLPKGMGFILRTAGMDRTKRELQSDLNYLTRLWKSVSERIKNDRAPATLYQESDLAIRTVRDVLEGDVERILVDDEATARKVHDFLTIAMPRAAEKVFVYKDHEPLFYRYGTEEEIDRLHSRHVPLPCGGSLVIESTEALVAIDVNSGKYREQSDAEETARRTNLEAAEEIARQLRLRDLGGVIVCDFIDMRLDRNCREVEKALRDALRRHKERGKILRMSRFGMIEMTRQRTRPSISRSIHQDCSHCKGTGMVKSPESTTLDAMRMLQLAVHRKGVHQLEIQVSGEVAFDLQNRKRQAIFDLETETGKTIVIRAVDGFEPGRVEFSCRDARGRSVKFP